MIICTGIIAMRTRDEQLLVSKLTSELYERVGTSTKGLVAADIICIFLLKIEDKLWFVIITNLP